MRRTLSQRLATTALLSLAVVAPASAKPVKDRLAADPALLKQVKRSYAVFRAPKRKSDVVRGVAHMPKADRKGFARAQSRLLGTVGGVKVYAMVLGKEFSTMAVPVGDGKGFVGAGWRFSLLAFDPLNEMRHVVRVPDGSIVRAAVVIDGTTNAVHRNADGTTTPVTVSRNLVADLSDGTGTVEWTRPDGTVATILPVTLGGSQG